MTKKLVIFGPFCGEFCYELSWWIPEIRKLRNTEFKEWDAIAISSNGREVLYRDFTNAFVPYTEELENTLKYPSTFGEHVTGGDIIPENLHDFVNVVGEEYQRAEGYDEVRIYNPNPTGLRERTLSEEPDGEYKHYEARDSILKEMKTELKNYFNNDRDTIAVMARIRFRSNTGKTCWLDWNPNHWETFINMLVNKLNLNVVMIGIPRKKGSSAGGALSFDNSKYIKSIVFTGPDSVEKQIALLQSTKCSIYGASGTAVFPFFIKGASTFTQQTSNEGFRLKLKWERDLTENLKNVKIFDKYRNYDLYDSPPEELFEEFKKFYEEIN